MFIEKIYEKVRSKIHEDPVDKLRRLGAEIGSNVHIYDGGGAIIDYDYAQLLKIGNNVTISSSTLLMHDASMKKELHYVKIGRIMIGDNVFIAPNCVFSTAGHAIDSEQRGRGLEIALPITVGDNVWIGANVTVLPGVTIGSNTIIGAGSVVNKDIPEGVIAVGNPCKVMRKITEEDKKKYPIFEG